MKKLLFLFLCLCFVSHLSMATSTVYYPLYMTYIDVYDSTGVIIRNDTIKGISNVKYPLLYDSCYFQITSPDEYDYIQHMKSIQRKKLENVILSGMNTVLSVTNISFGLKGIHNSDYLSATSHLGIASLCSIESIHNINEYIYFSHLLYNMCIMPSKCYIVNESSHILYRNNIILPYETKELGYDIKNNEWRFIDNRGYIYHIRTMNIMCIEKGWININKDRVIVKRKINKADNIYLEIDLKDYKILNVYKEKNNPYIKKFIKDNRPKSIRRQEVINKLNKIYGNKYDYSCLKALFSTKTSITVICPIHGKFHVNLKKHLNGKGCPKCSKEN